MAENVMNKLGLFGSNVPGLLDKGLANLYDRNALIGLESRYGNQYGLEQTGTGIGSDARHMAAMNNLSNTLSKSGLGIAMGLPSEFAGDIGAFGAGLINEIPALSRGFNKQNLGEIVEDIKANYAGSFGTPNSTTAEDIYSQVFTEKVPQRFASGTPMGYGAAQASDLTNLERDFPGMSTGDIIDSMNNRQRANRFSGMGQMGPNKSNMNAPAALDMDRFAGVSNLGRNDMDVEQVEQLGSPSRFQGFKNQMSNFMDNPVTRGLGTALNFARGSLPGMIMSGIGSLFSRNPNAPSYQTRSPNIDYSNLNTTNLNDFYDSNPDSDTFGTTRFDRAVPGSFGSFRTLAGYLNRNKTAAAALTTKKAKKEAAMQQQIKDAEARQAVLAARQAAANRSGVGYRSSRDHSGSGGYGGSDKRSADNRSSDLGFSDIRLKDNIELVGKSPSDINIYNFTYLNDPKVYQGVMAQEVPWASVEHNSGYLMVDYSKVDVEFKRKDAVASMFTRRG